eukprot:gene14468-5529_t
MILQSIATFSCLFLAASAWRLATQRSAQQRFHTQNATKHTNPRDPVVQFAAYCPKANCPPKIRVKEPNSCCEKCPSNWKPAGPPTFPPFPPFPGFPPVGDEAEVAAEDDAKANQV